MITIFTSITRSHHSSPPEFLCSTLGLQARASWSFWITSLWSPNHSCGQSPVAGPSLPRSKPKPAHVRSTCVAAALLGAGGASAYYTGDALGPLRHIPGLGNLGFSSGQTTSWSSGGSNREMDDLKRLVCVCTKALFLASSSWVLHFCDWYAPSEACACRFRRD